MTKRMDFSPGAINPFQPRELTRLLHILEHGRDLMRVYVKPGSAPVPYREGVPLRWRAKIDIGVTAPTFNMRRVYGDETFEERNDAEAHACRVANSFAREMGDAMPSHEFVVNMKGLPT